MILTMMVCLVCSLCRGATTVSATGECESKSKPGDLICSYVFNLVGLIEGQMLDIGLQLPPEVSTATSWDLGCNPNGTDCQFGQPQYNRRGSYVEHTIAVAKAKDTGSIKFKVSGPADEFVSKAKGWYVEVSSLEVAP